MLVYTAGLSQTWPELKSRIQAESDKNKRGIQNARIDWPLQFSDSSNHFLMQAVYPSGKPIYLTTLNAQAALTTGASLLQSGNMGFALSGEGRHIFQWDAGAVQSHIEFGKRVLANEGVFTDRHATHVAGTLIASGNNPQAKGMAPAASLHAYYFDDDIYELAVQSEKNQYGYLISNHSYGIATGWNRLGNGWQWLGDELVSNTEDFTAGFYSLRAKQLDDIAYLSPYHTIVWAAGNDRADTGNGSRPADCNGGTGYDCIVQEGTAKNIITVGGVDQVVNYAGPTSVPMSHYSSWGPTDDGRIKPDLVAQGTNLLSTTNAGVDQYTTLGGTSMATANVSGSLLLLQDLYGKLQGGRFMRAATLKALVIHTAKETGAAPGPDYSFGWGLLDVAEAGRLLSQRDDVNTFVVESELPNDAVHEWVLNPQANKKITATLVWNDPSGIPPGALLDAPYKMLINDLDLRLLDETTVSQLPWLLDPANPSAGAVSGDNTRDNVEKIEFNFPQTKPYKLRLAHKGFLVGGAQQYSLIITYTSTNTAKTLYWIGGSGDWNDAMHWSFSSGGNPANVTPSQHDCVIVDENSFDGPGSITLSSNVTCTTLRWYCSKEAGINFNTKALTVGKELVLASDKFQKSGRGRFILNTMTTGVINANGLNSVPVNVDFTKGDWSVYGDLNADSVIISGGAVVLQGTKVTVNHFLGLGSGSKLQANQAIIKVKNSWRSDETKTTLISMNSSFIADGTHVQMQVNSLNWKGTLINTNSMTITGALTVDSLHLDPGSALMLNAGTSLQVNGGMYFNGTHGNVTTLTASAPASIHVLDHRKYCVDFVSVSNINLTGSSVWNVGSNSTLQNTSGWLNQDCDDVLFPDFTFRYACVNAITEFTDSSLGNIDSFHWDFGDMLADNNESNQQNPTHQFTSPGDYTVVLTITSHNVSSSYARTITILPNTLPPVTVQQNSEILFSNVEANSYKWFANDQVVLGETSRFYKYAGAEGYYRVVLYDDYCNNPSEWLLITGLDPEGHRLIYPNPASDRLYFSVSGVENLSFKDSIGRSYDVTWDSAESWVDVSTLPAGLYVLLLRSGNQVLKSRIWINK